ncbi:bte binding protein 4 [Phaffia rhodozyma]|uniref:Bte binding protein 4 n=1 Tax=Phaffia rhodozyma TaxID=264483 RepID=A0A0F7SK14_PHARH|nr:bte binding protein 4 [Phaffia rhodozyma]
MIRQTLSPLDNGYSAYGHPVAGPSRSNQHLYPQPRDHIEPGMEYLTSPFNTRDPSASNNTISFNQSANTTSTNSLSVARVLLESPNKGSLSTFQAPAEHPVPNILLGPVHEEGRRWDYPNASETGQSPSTETLSGTWGSGPTEWPYGSIRKERGRGRNAVIREEYQSIDPQMLSAPPSHLRPHPSNLGPHSPSHSLQSLPSPPAPPPTQLSTHSWQQRPPSHAQTHTQARTSGHRKSISESYYTNVHPPATPVSYMAPTLSQHNLPPLSPSPRPLPYQATDCPSPIAHHPGWDDALDNFLAYGPAEGRPIDIPTPPVKSNSSVSFNEVKLGHPYIAHGILFGTEGTPSLESHSDLSPDFSQPSRSQPGTPGSFTQLYALDQMVSTSQQPAPLVSPTPSSFSYQPHYQFRPSQPYDPAMMDNYSLSTSLVLQPLYPTSPPVETYPVPLPPAADFKTHRRIMSTDSDYSTPYSQTPVLDEPTSPAKPEFERALPVVGELEERDDYALNDLQSSLVVRPPTSVPSGLTLSHSLDDTPKSKRALKPPTRRQSMPASSLPPSSRIKLKKEPTITANIIPNDPGTPKGNKTPLSSKGSLLAMIGRKLKPGPKPKVTKSPAKSHQRAQSLSSLSITGIVPPSDPSRPVLRSKLGGTPTSSQPHLQPRSTSIGLYSAEHSPDHRPSSPSSVFLHTDQSSPQSVRSNKRLPLTKGKKAASEKNTTEERPSLEITQAIITSLYEPIHPSDRSRVVSSMSPEPEGPDDGADRKAKMRGKEEMRYRCLVAECDRVFPRKSAIIHHIQMHLEDKPFACEAPGCHASFVRQHDLRRHERIHSDTKPFSCPCGKGFSRGDALVRHRQRAICIGGTPDTAPVSLKRRRGE